MEWLAKWRISGVAASATAKAAKTGGMKAASISAAMAAAAISENSHHQWRRLAWPQRNESEKISER